MFGFFSLTKNGLFFVFNQSVFVLEKSISILFYLVRNSNNVRTAIPVPPFIKPLYGDSR